MKSEKRTTIKNLLRNHRKEGAVILKMLSLRLRRLKEIAIREDEPGLARLVRAFEKYEALDDLYRSMLLKRSRKTATGEHRYTPFEKSAFPVTDSLARHIFKPN